MKTIGYIEPAFTNEEISDEDEIYLGGSIVMLSRSEVATLKMLQDAWDGELFKWPPLGSEKMTAEMSDIFKAIRCFTEAKFAVNEFRHAINRLEDILIEVQEVQEVQDEL